MMLWFLVTFCFYRHLQVSAPYSNIIVSTLDRLDIDNGAQDEVLFKNVFMYFIVGGRAFVRHRVPLEVQALLVEVTFHLLW